jgi:AmmeMemoRadiSam system protein B
MLVRISIETDEEEHSIEMQLPFLHHVLGNQPFQIVPIIVGETIIKLSFTHL